MKLLLTTISGGRSVCWNQLVHYIKEKNNYDGDWLLVSDDHKDYDIPSNVILVENPVDNKKVKNTFLSNWEILMKYMEDHPEYTHFLNLEEDDFYWSGYVGEMKKLFSKAELIGLYEDAYYYVDNRRSRRTHNQDMATLATTGWSRDVLPHLRKCVDYCVSEKSYMLDVAIWHGYKEYTYMKQITSMDEKTMMGDTVGMELAPVKMERIAAYYNGDRLLLHNFYGRVRGDVRPLKTNIKGDIEGEFPRHVGMKGSIWHGGRQNTSVEQGVYSAGIDMRAKILQKWVGSDLKDFYLRNSPTKGHNFKDGKSLPEFTIMDMPTEEEIIQGVYE